MGVTAPLATPSPIGVRTIALVLCCSAAGSILSFVREGDTQAVGLQWTRRSKNLILFLSSIYEAPDVTLAAHTVSDNLESTSN